MPIPKIKSRPVPASPRDMLKLVSFMLECIKPLVQQLLALFDLPSRDASPTVERLLGSRENWHGAIEVSAQVVARQSYAPLVRQALGELSARIENTNLSAWFEEMDNLRRLLAADQANASEWGQLSALTGAFPRLFAVCVIGEIVLGASKKRTRQSQQWINQMWDTLFRIEAEVRRYQLLSGFFFSPSNLEAEFSGDDDQPRRQKRPSRHQRR